MKYFIGKIAKLYGLSPQTIHHYENMGLIKLNKEETSNYRYFDNINIQKLGSIKKLRNLDVPLKDTSVFLENSNLSKQYSLYKELLIDNQEQLNNLLYKNEIINNIMHCISVANIKDYYEIQEIEDIYYLKVNTVITDDDIENTKYWFTNLLYTNIGHQLNRSERKPSKGFVVIAGKKAIDNSKLNKIEKANKFPSNKFVVKSFLLDKNDNEYLLFEFMDKFISEHPEYNYSDDAYVELIVVFNDEEDKKRILVKLYLPIIE